MALKADVSRSDALAARWPGELLASEDVDVEMVDALAAFPAVVDDHSVALGQALLLGDLPGGHEEVAKELWRKSGSKFRAKIG